MSLRKLPEVNAFERPAGLQWDMPSDALARWAESPMAAEGSGDNVITIFDMIGEDYWSGGGFTAKRAAAALRSIGKRDIVVQVNSPGGDLFEGLAIYNLLRAHEGKVTVNVLGYAASAASIIAMAGDEINMGLGTFLMIHRAWGGVLGNEEDFSQAAEIFRSFDAAMVDIYEARTGQPRSTIEKLMKGVSDGTWMSPSEAVDKGFADKVDDSLQAGASANPHDNPVKARRRIEAALAKNGVSRAQRADLLNEFSGAQRDASSHATRDAGVSAAEVSQLMQLFKI